MRKRRGFSPVIATVVLAAVVLAIGGSVWYYAIGASTVVANSYVNETLEGLYEVTERFIIEHIYYDSVNSEMQVWVYNYGKMKITVDVLIKAVNIEIGSKYSIDIEAKSIKEIHVPDCSATSYSFVSVRLYSARGNIVDASYYVP